jgi:NAD(P)-dependent dehydrogenase (short-subunit alcohol dehydrogenase family)
MPTIVMTGATSGLGLVAAETLFRDGATVIVGARGGGVPDGAEQRSLDLASLASVRAFAEALPERIDALILNAGMQNQNVTARTVDGFEQTFAVNHLAPYLLARLALPKLATGARLVLTSSGTHDPREKTGIPAPRHSDAARLAHPDTDPDCDDSAITAGLRAYSTSKLCNLMTARTLARDTEVLRRGIVVHAYDPGFVPATGLARNSPWPVRRIVMPLLARFPMLRGMNRLSDAGNALAGLATGAIDAPAVYMALRRGQPTWPEPSALALDDEACARLWADSATIVGLPV